MTLESIIAWKRHRAFLRILQPYLEWEKEQMLERLFAPNLLMERLRRVV